MNPAAADPLLSFTNSSSTEHQAIRSGASTLVEYIPNAAGTLQVQVGCCC